MMDLEIGEKLPNGLKFDPAADQTTGEKIGEMAGETTTLGQIDLTLGPTAAGVQMQS